MTHLGYRGIENFHVSFHHYNHPYIILYHILLTSSWKRAQVHYRRWNPTTFQERYSMSALKTLVTPEVSSGSSPSPLGSGHTSGSAGMCWKIPCFAPNKTDFAIQSGTTRQSDKHNRLQMMAPGNCLPLNKHTASWNQTPVTAKTERLSPLPGYS